MKQADKARMKARKYNLKLEISYDGSKYHGFQRQNKVVAVQNVLEKALMKLCNEDIQVAAAGRTDAGVHAVQQVVNFFTNTNVPLTRFCYALNRLLPDDVVARKVEVADENFSALHSVVSKEYIYKVHVGKTPDPFRHNYSTYINKPLNTEAMAEALKVLEGEHDFSAFRSVGGNDTSPIRKIYRAEVTAKGDELCFRFWSNGFLYHMVRNIMGVVLNIGLGYKPVSEMRCVLDSKDRSEAGRMAPANGLYLYRVYYK